MVDPLNEALMPLPAPQVQAAMPDIRVPVVRVFGATPAGQRGTYTCSQSISNLVPYLTII